MYEKEDFHVVFQEVGRRKQSRRQEVLNSCIDRKIRDRKGNEKARNLISKKTTLYFELKTSEYFFIFAYISAKMFF